MDRLPRGRSVESAGEGYDIGLDYFLYFGYSR